MRLNCLLAIACWSTTTSAQPSTRGEPTAADVATAPLPGQESGRLDEQEQDSLLRNLAQGALVAPRVALEIAAAPIRGSLWVYDRYQLGERFKRIFFDDTYTYGLYPTLVFDSSYGVTAGARFVHRNLFGHREHLAIRAGGGGEFRARARGALRTGALLGSRMEAELGGEVERRPNDAFYGIGAGSDGMAAHHRQQLLRATASYSARLVDALYLRGSSAFTDLELDATDEAMPIDTLYPPEVLVGWSGARNVYGELELRWDSRGHVTALDRYRVFDRGWLVSAYGGRIHQLREGRDYWRYGGDLQHFWRLGAGPRALATRIHLDAVTGEIGDVVFTQLPQLGGHRTLRGYPRERFRDRIAVMGSLEYHWDVGRQFMASLFTDVGRVLPNWSELPQGVYMGYGLSFQLHDSGRYVAGVALSSSIDGGVFVNFSLDPVFEVEPRVEQR